MDNEINPPASTDYNGFDAAAYLRTYYSRQVNGEGPRNEIAQDEWRLAQWIAKELPPRLHGFLDRTGRMPDRVIGLSEGPTMHHLFQLIALRRKVKLTASLPIPESSKLAYLHTDYSKESLRAVAMCVAPELFKSIKGQAFDWSLHAEAALNVYELSEENKDVLALLQEAKSALVSESKHLRLNLAHINLSEPNSIRSLIHRGMPKQFDMAQMFYVADSATADKNVWVQMMRNGLNLLAPGGIFVGSALDSTERYRVNGHWFASANVSKEYLKDFFLNEPEINPDSVEVDCLQTPLLENEGFTSVVPFIVEKKPKSNPLNGRVYTY